MSRVHLDRVGGIQTGRNILNYDRNSNYCFGIIVLELPLRPRIRGAPPSSAIEARVPLVQEIDGC